MKGLPNSPLPVAMREDANADQGEQISHGSESDIGSIGVIIIGIEEEIQPKRAALPQKSGVLDLGDGHVVIPFGYKYDVLLGVFIRHYDRRGSAPRPLRELGEREWKRL